MRSKRYKIPRAVAREMLAARAEQRIRAMDPIRGQIRPAEDEEDQSIFVNKPSDPNGYGAGIFIRDGRLADYSVEEAIEKFGEEFFLEKLLPHLKVESGD